MVELVLFDLKGRRVRTLVGESPPAGTHRARWDGRDKSGSRAAAGIYFARLSVAGVEGSETMTRKITLLP